MKNDKYKRLGQIQISVLIYSLVSVFSKVSSNSLKQYGLFSSYFILSIAMMIFLLAMYAILWQAILRKVDLSTAYINKAFTLFWTMIWSVVIFGEYVTLMNIVGLMFIIVGVILVTKNEL